MKKILLIQLRQLGDILLTTPVIRAIREQFPSAQIDFLAHRMGRPILEDNPYLSSTYTYSEQHSIGEAYRLLKKLRGEKYDLVLDFMNNPRSALQTFFINSEKSLSFDSRRRFLYGKTIPGGNSQNYIVNQKFELLKAAGINGDNIKLSFEWNQDHLEPFKHLVAQREDFAVSKLRVVISPTHRRIHRQWPAQHYAVLADILVKNWNASVTWIWGPGEEEYIDQIIERCAEKTIKAPRTTLKEMAALIANHDLFIGNSNGPSHIAVATNICSLQLHGHTIASSWCPNNDRHRSIQSPIGEENLDKCMPVITVPIVLEKLTRMKEEIEKISESRRNKGIISDVSQQHT